MHELRGSSRRPGALRRPPRRLQRALLGAGFLASLGAAATSHRFDVPEASAEPSSSHTSVPFYLRGEARRLHQELNEARGRLDLVTAQLERANEIIEYSTRYRIGADLAGDILDIAMAEGIDPALGFRLVAVESRFNERATSPVGAVGLTQVMLPTARYFEREITREQLYHRQTNLRVGFRYLRTLIRQYGGDIELALLVYNRGPIAVESSLRAGEDPSNGYARVVLGGYSGTGTVD